MYYSEKDIRELQNGYATITEKYLKLMVSYLDRDYDNHQAKEYARHGFLRRLGTLARCIENTFETIPPDQGDLPVREELMDVGINIQAFVVNVFGSADNLAWIWVLEKGLTKDDGTPIPKSWVGLRKGNKFVRKSLSPIFSKYLDGLEKWFENLEGFRHALAHRIPLYIPPYSVPEKQVDRYQELEAQITETRSRGEIAECERLSAEQDALGEFVPWMTHSFEEHAPHVFFHAQLLADFDTVDQLGQKMLEELDR